MKKINYLLLIMLLFFALGCRSDYMNEIDSGKALGSFSYKQIDKEKIPQIMNFLSAKTENFKIPIKTTSALNKTETVFGEINTDYIIETINEDNETYYVFSVVPNESTDSKVYNLEVKSDNSTSESAKVIVYQPTEDWLLNGNGNYSVFSGKTDTYSLDGDIESSAQYLRGVGNCNPDPCPDCPGTGGSGSGGGGSGGPLNPGSGNPHTSGGGMPTQCVGCNPGGNPGTNNPPANPNSPPSSPPPGESAGSGMWFFKCIDEGDGNGLKCYWLWNKNVNRLINPCGSGGGVVVAPQDTPCEKTQKMLTNPKTKPAIDVLKAQSTLGGEKGVKIKADGTPSAIINGGPHNVDFGDKTGYRGGYHNHTPTGIPMLSPPDIDQLLGFVRAQGNGDAFGPGNAYLGMVAPNGMHYVIRFRGNYNDALVTFTDDDLKKFKKGYGQLVSDLTEPILNGTTYINNNGSINNKGVEKLFFETLKDMNLLGKVMLQRVENSGAVQTINLDNNNQPIAVPCS